MDTLIHAWREKATSAREWAPGQDPDPVLEALALTLALELAHALPQVPPAERDTLRRLGQRALLHVGGAGLDEDDLESLRLAASLARDGLRALSGKPAEAPTPDVAALDVRVVIPPTDLSRLLDGSLDGYAAGALARKVRRSDAARAELDLLLEHRAALRGDEAREAVGQAPPALSLAAAPAMAVLDPAGGRVLGDLAALGAEAVLFETPGEPRRIAVYCEEAAVLRLVADALSTEEMREGYWMGRVEEGVSSVEATLHLGDRSAPWQLELA